MNTIRPGERSATAPGRSVSVVVARDGRLPVGAEGAVQEAGGSVVVVGTGTESAARMLAAARQAWWCETGPAFRPGELATALAPVLAGSTLVVMPSSPDGRDLAPRLAAALDRPLVAGALSVTLVTPDASVPPTKQLHPGQHVKAMASRLDDRVLVPVTVEGGAVVTLLAGHRSTAASSPATHPATLFELELPANGSPSPGEPELLELLEPDPATMDLADATRVLGGGAGLVAGQSDRAARETFGVLAEVSAVLGASVGGTRVASDAGWIDYDRQIGTTGVNIDPALYIAFGVSGASQHVSGLGSPRHIVSVNNDPSCPMTTMADLGLVTDAAKLLAELARRFEITAGPAASTATTTESTSEIDNA